MAGLHVVAAVEILARNAAGDVRRDLGFLLGLYEARELMRVRRVLPFDLHGFDRYHVALGLLFLSAAGESHHAGKSQCHSNSFAPLAVPNA